MKKLVFSLGAVAVAVVPCLTVVACGESDSSKYDLTWGDKVYKPKDFFDAVKKDGEEKAIGKEIGIGKYKITVDKTSAIAIGTAMTAKGVPAFSMLAGIVKMPEKETKDFIAYITNELK